MNRGLPTQACWTAANAGVVLHNEALEGGAAAFMATHLPVRDFSIGGTHGREITSPTERDVLEILASSGRRHAFCAVEGEPGSGKSHLVRWLSINWPKSDRVLLLQRLDGSLQGALRQLQKCLGPEFSHLFERVGQRQLATLEGRADLFLSSLSASLKPDHFEKPLPDSDWCRQNDPATLLRNRKVQESWTAPARILRLLDGAGGERNSLEAWFNVADIAELATFHQSVGETFQAIQLVRKLMHESGLVRGWIDIGLTPAQIKKEHHDRLPVTIKLVEALNERFNYSIQHVLGISGEGLKGLFRELRQALKQRAERLVLLLEDITSWQGIDDSLVDALVIHAETREAGGQESDLCDLISVVGVTPQYYEQLQANYRQRITHHIKLGKESGAFQDVATLRDSTSRVAFVARYLAAARAGKNKLDAWGHEFIENPDQPPPNVCNACPVRENCHAAFGHHNEVGLFPFTPLAITQLFDSLKEADGNQTWKTPRGIIQAILSPTLDHPEVIDARHYPGPEIETAKLEENSGSLSGFARSTIDARVENAQIRDQLRRLVAFWGDKQALETRKAPDGSITFANIPRAVFDALGLPWLGDTVAPTFTQPPPTEEPRTEGRQSGEPSPKAKPLAVRPSKPVAPSAKKLRQMLADIETWRNKNELPNPSNWNKLLAEVVRDEVDKRLCGIDNWLAGKLFTQDTVRIENTGATDSRHFVVPSTDWVKDGLEAYAALKSKIPATDQEAEFYRKCYARFLRRLVDEIASFADRRRPLLGDGSQWNYLASATQVLLTRAWLRGAIRPTEPTSTQWCAILQEEGIVTTSPTTRTQKWSDIVETTSNSHDKFRALLRTAVSLPQGISQEFGLADAGVTAQAVVSLRDCLALNTIPPQVPTSPQWMSDLALLAEVGRRVQERLPRICTDESSLLDERGKQVMTLLRGLAINAHAKRLNDALDAVIRQLHQAAPEAVQRWRQEFRRLPENQALSGLEQWLSSRFDDERGRPDQPAEVLKILAEAPSGDLYSVLTALSEGEKAVKLVLNYVADYVEGQEAGSGSAQTVREAGTQILSAVSAARQALKRIA